MRNRRGRLLAGGASAMMAMMIGHVPNWGHLSAAFSPWHRVLLFRFEFELRAINASVALPYWDWTDLASTTSVFSSDLVGGDGPRSEAVGLAQRANFATAVPEVTLVPL